LAPLGFKGLTLAAKFPPEVLLGSSFEPGWLCWKNEIDSWVDVVRSADSVL